MIGWTIEELDKLRQMHADGKTFSEMGAALNRSRNSIAGKVSRLKLPRKSKPQKNFVIIHKRHERKPRMFLRVVTAPDSTPVTLMERTGCCFPTTGEKPHLFCNAPTEKGDYCEFHQRVMYYRRAA